jgi:hypothetical protein
MTAGELAEAMGISVSTIKRMTAAGMPSETWGLARTRRYLASECIKWARDRPARVESRSRRITVAQRKD